MHVRPTTGLINHGNPMARSRQKPSIYQGGVDALRFGTHLMYEGPYDGVKILTDFNDEDRSEVLLNRFNKVLEFVLLKRHQGITGFRRDRSARWNPDQIRQTASFQVFPVNNSLPFGDIARAALSLHQAGQEPNKKIFIHATNPLSTVDKVPAKQSILITPNNGMYVGFNNGALELLARMLEQGPQKYMRKPYQLYEIDVDKVRLFEQARTTETADLSREFYVPAIVAAAIAGGIAPEAFAKLSLVDRDVTVKQTGFLPEEPAQLPERDHTERYKVLVDSMTGNLVTNVLMTQEAFEALVDERPILWVSNTSRIKGHHQIRIQAVRSIGELQPGHTALVLGRKSLTADGSLRFVELMRHSGNVAEALNIQPGNGIEVHRVLP